MVVSLPIVEVQHLKADKLGNKYHIIRKLQNSVACIFPRMIKIQCLKVYTVKLVTARTR